MGQSIFDYAAAHGPFDEPDDLYTVLQRENMKQAEQRQKNREQAEQLKKSILTQLERGNDPQIILYTALKCIGLYTNDPDYITATTGHLNSIYEDLAQQSFIQDNEQIAADRLQKQRKEYNQHLRNSINRQLAGYHRIEKALTDALNELNDMDEPPLLSD